MNWLMFFAGLFLIIFGAALAVLSVIHDRVELSEDESEVVRRMLDKGQG